jgi:hypothetical protein
VVEVAPGDGRQVTGALMRLVLLSAVAAMLAAARPSPGPINLQPVTNWKVDYSANSCVLSRQFAAAGRAYDFELTFAPIEKRAWLRIGSPDKIKRFDDGDAAVEVDGAKLAEPTHFNVFANATGGTTREFLFPQFARDVGRADRSLRLVPARHGDFLLGVPDFPGAMRAMASCMDDLHRSIDVDPAVLQGIATDPEGSSLPFVRSPDREFVMQVLYWVTAEGRVDECRILKASGIDDFDQRYCEELKRNGRFKPAKSVGGTPTRAPVFEDLNVRRDERISTSPLVSPA